MNKELQGAIDWVREFQCTIMYDEDAVPHIETILETLEQTDTTHIVSDKLYVSSLKKPVPEHYDDNHRTQVLRNKGWNACIDHLNAKGLIKAGAEE